ncbi:MAG TPA: glycosyltransferase [Nitrospirae bacterium]|nr:undecaprenyl-phosphate mannosyltransferase [bacterium BMS3Abin06]HDH13040.1 glycosyltransferase [Nitrospirota bacterium]HDZ00593.1 glycosyltransferase [Nitrospirota bacterium]
MTKSSLVILTLNEIEGISALFDKIPFNEVDESFVVDGGSTDGTVEFFRERGVRVVSQKSRGRGEAFRIAERESSGDYLIFFSPDGNEDPGDIPGLLKLLDEGYDMAIASRFLPLAKNEEDDLRFPWRAWANRAFTFVANTIWNKNKYITDTINGYRAIKKEAFRRLKVDAPGFAIEYQISIRAMKLGLKIAETPTIEGQRIGGESTAESIPTGLLFLRFLFREIKIGRNL